MNRAYFRTEQHGYIDHVFYGIAGLDDEKRTELEIHVNYDTQEGTVSGQLIIKDDNGDYALESSFDLSRGSADALVNILSQGVPIE